MQYVLALLMILPFTGFGQVQLSFQSTSKSKDIDHVNFKFDAPEGVHRFSSTVNPNLVKANVKYEKENYNISFDEKSEGKNSKVALIFKKKEEPGLVESIVKLTRKEEKNSPNSSNVFFGLSPLYKFNFNFGFGDADICLSDLKTQKCFVNAGSANVRLFYQKARPNKTRMKDLHIKAGMGNVVLENIELSEAERIEVDVEFGNATLTFGSVPKHKINVVTKVGAGSTKIKLPEKTPVLIHTNGTSMSKITIPKGFKKKSEGVYINDDYFVNSPHAIEFDLEISMGKVIFE